MQTVRLLYYSTFRLDRTERPLIVQLDDLLSSCQRNNQAQGITGALIFDSDWFVQALEGELDAVWAAFNKILPDPRHSDVKFIEMVAIESRDFGNWWMGCAERNRQTASIFEPYLREGQFRPDIMPSSEILALLRDLSKIGFGATP